MKVKIQKINRRFPRKFFNVVKYLKNMKISFYVLLRLIKLRYPFSFIKYRVISLISYSLIYPMIRLALGTKKAITICSFFETAFRPSGILPLPPSCKSKIIIPKHISDFDAYRDIYENDFYRMRMIENGMVVVDIGANIGVYTILVTEKVGENGKVIAVEPEPQNYNQLLENMRLNNFKNVIPQNIALTDHEGFENLYISSYSDGHSLLLRENEIDSIKVLVRTLDGLLEELDLKRIDIIKIDAEGSEIPILKGAEKTLKANPNVKIIVAAEHYPSEIEEVCQFLNKRGFKIKVSHSSIVMTV